MPAIASPVQFDKVSGLDFSGLASVTAVELLQSINQLAPLANIGGVIVLDGSVYFPGVTANPRFKRYIWIDTQGGTAVAKIYDQSGADTYAAWVDIAISDGSVTTAKLADLSVTVGKIAVGTARFLLRTNAAGTAVEFVNPNSIFAAGDIEVDKLGHTGAPASVCYLKKDAAGTKSWANPSFADFPAGTTLAQSQISPSATNGQVIGTVAGIAAWAHIKDLIPIGSEIPITKVDGSGAAAYQVLRKNAGNTALEYGTLPINRYYTFDAGNLGAILPSAAATGAVNFAHGLGAFPVLVKCVLRCINAELGYVAGDETPFESVYDNPVADQRGRPCFSYAYDATNVTLFALNSAAGDRIMLRRDTGAPTAMTDANWRVRIYAFV
jgi:hypothetical protein